MSEDEYVEGSEARQNDIPQGDNPYTPQTAAHESWNDGWIDTGDDEEN